MGIITERERQKYFAYLDGVADGLNESSRDTINVLDKIRAEIDHDMREAPYMYDDEHINELYSYQDGLEHTLNIIDKYRKEKE